MENKIKSIKRIESAIIDKLGESGLLKTNNTIQKKARKLAKEVVKLLLNEHKKSLKEIIKNEKKNNPTPVTHKDKLVSVIDNNADKAVGSAPKRKSTAINVKTTPVVKSELKNKPAVENKKNRSSTVRSKT